MFLLIADDEKELWGPLQYIRNVAISSYMSTWKNNEWACLHLSSLHAAYDQKGRPFILENV